MMSRGKGQRSGASELVSGVGKGLVGVFTKPIGGAAEFLSQTGQGRYSASLIFQVLLKFVSIEVCVFK